MSVPSDAVRRASRRAVEEPFFLAGALESYKEENDLDDAGLAAFLGCGPDDLPRLALCRRPREATFPQDVAHLARRFSLDGARLAQLVREVEVLEEFRGDEAAISMAARDRDGEDPR